MVKKIFDSELKFSTIFNTLTGEYLRGYDVDFEPFKADFPHLIDVGVMG